MLHGLCWGNVFFVMFNEIVIRGCNFPDSAGNCGSVKRNADKTKATAWLPAFVVVLDASIVLVS